MTIKYLVDVIAQKSWKACWYTALLMLVRYKRFALHTKYQYLGFLILDYPWLKLDSLKAEKELQHLFKMGEIPKFIQKYSFLSKHIPISPESFEEALKKFGPFIYVATVPGSIAGFTETFEEIRYQHTVLITGIEKKRGKYILSYNDPAGGRKVGPGSKPEPKFFDFVTSILPPALTSMGGGMTLVIYL